MAEQQQQEQQAGWLDEAAGWLDREAGIGQCGAPTRSGGRCREAISGGAPCRYHAWVLGPDGWGVPVPRAPREREEPEEEEGGELEGDLPTPALAAAAEGGEAVDAGARIPAWVALLPVDRPASAGEALLALQGAVNQAVLGELDAKSLAEVRESLLRAVDAQQGGSDG